MTPYELVERQMAEYARLMPAATPDAVRIYGRRVAMACGIEPVWLDWTHGTVTTYQAHGCHCVECRARIAEVKRGYARRKRFRRELQSRGFVVKAA